MKRWKSILKMFCVMAVLFAVFTGDAIDVQAAENIASGQCGESLYWALDAQGHMTISGTGKMWNMREEGTIYDYHECPWADYKEQITSLTFEDGVTYVGADAFMECGNLKEVTFSDSILVIGNFAFMRCVSLEDFTFPSELQALGQQAFDSCTSLTSVIIPDNVTFLDGAIFGFCTSLKDVYIGGKEKVGSYIYGNSIFRYCTALEEIQVSENNPALKAIDGVLFSKGDGKLVQYPCGKKDAKYVIPDGTTDIFAGAIEGALYLEEIVIPESVERISHSNMSDCPKLKFLDIPESVTDLGDDVGMCCRSLTHITNNSNCTMVLTGLCGYMYTDADLNELMQMETKSTIYQYKVPVGIIADAEIQMKTGESMMFPCEVSYFEESPLPSLDDLIFISSDESILTINEYGEASPKREGQVVVNVESPYEKNAAGDRLHIGTCIVIVKDEWDSESDDNDSNIENSDDNDAETDTPNEDNDKNEATYPQDGWHEESDAKYWYEDGVRQGCEDRGKEIYDAASDAWYWLDAPDGRMATGKDVYQESLAGNWGDYIGEDGQRYGKWVRYDESGHMIKGWQETENGKYFFDYTYGTMAKGYATIDGVEYYFNPQTGALEATIGEVPENGWKTIEGKDFWYENYVRQGYCVDESYRGKEIYDETSNAWYWLDNVQGGAKAVSKDVYQESLSGDWGDYVGEDGQHYGKWVRYDENGHMIKGWQTTEDGTYYFDEVYGTMAKNSVTINGTSYYFNINTGLLE